ncbi:hypothetical protein JRO89_XS04G0271800 [Xanthoceras sorbifolium]|uniref:2-methoxy-6-polyprenyl-1,4-benzoquinol methylase, mitochondrial n=1 Tax=Xanthoceras sorbifolium TaxID=99658 RepID=A0ABQ8I7F0_9ROSI|nr:hypothetical protein JRO89_XS04G0271800 [Xanthoceras sorbifolium]
MALRLMAKKLESKLLPMLSSNSLLHSHATSFGFKEVREEEKSQMVGTVFSSVASNYDVMNDVMSGGLHRLWKDRLVSKLNPFPGMKHLDVAGGTGDVSFKILETINNIKRRALQDVLEDDLMEETRIYVCDINPNMLNVGKRRALERGLRENKSLVWVEGDAEALRFEDDTMDGYTIAFGIRNVTHIEKVLAEAYRVLKRGGRFLCLELSQVEVPLFKELYNYYSFSVIPAIGELVAGDRDSYQYLVESIRRFPPQMRCYCELHKMNISLINAYYVARQVQDSTDIDIFVMLRSYVGPSLLNPAALVTPKPMSGSPLFLISKNTIDETVQVYLYLPTFSFVLKKFKAKLRKQYLTTLEKFASMIADAGFQKVEYENLVGGVVAIHSGLKI